MLPSEESFSYDMGGLDRTALLNDAVSSLNALGGHLGSKAAPAQSPAAEMASALLKDTAEFADTPVVRKITNEHFLARYKQVPESFKNLSRDYDYYWVYLPIALFPRYGWAFNRLEVSLEFNPGVAAGHTRPKAYQILPEKQFETLLQANGSVQVQVGENLQFAAGTDPISVQAGPVSGNLEASVEAGVAGSAGLVLGPFTYRLKGARIDHTATGLEKVFWRLDGAQFFQDNVPQLVVIAQVPRSTKTFKAVAAMQAYRYFNMLSANLRDTILEAPQAILTFFRGGAPIRHEAAWNLLPSS